MAAERFFGYGNSPIGTNYTIRIYDIDYVGSSTEFQIQRGGIVVNWEASDAEDRHSPIVGSSCTVTMVADADNATLEAFIGEVRTAKEGQFWMELVSGGTPDVRWRGILTADISREVDQGTSYAITISAVCGLALLKDIPYHDGSAIYTGSNRLTKHIARCIGKLSHIDFWGATDAFLETSVDWWAETMTTGGANDALFQAHAYHSAFYDFNTKGDVDKDVLSCYDVVAAICLAFGCTIKMQDGVFRVEQVDYRANPTYSYRQYDKNGDFVTSGSHAGVTTINQTAASGAKVSFVDYDYLPQLSEARVTYDVFVRRNFWENIILAESVTYNFDEDIDSNAGVATLRMKGTFYVNIKNNSYSGNPSDIIFPELRLKVKVGTKYLKRQGTYAGFKFNPGVAEWTSTSTDNVWIVPAGMQVAATGLSNSFVFGFDLITPPLVEDGDLNSLFCTFFQMKRNNNEDVDESQFTITWSAGSLFMEVFSDGTPDVAEDQILSYTENPDGGTKVWEANVRIGGNGVNYLGRLSSSTNYKYLNWGQGTDTPSVTLGSLLSKQVLNGQYRPMKRLNGTIYANNLDPRKYIVTSDGLHWLSQRISWYPTEGTITGSWFEIDYGGAGAPATPIKIKVLTGGTKLPQISGPSTPIPTGNGNQGFAANSPGVVLAPIAFNALATAITKGDTITSIDLEDASTGDEFLAGDGVTLAHPITGQFQTFTVATAPGVGDTSISVTSVAADFDAPVGSFLVVKQKAFAFALPPGTHEGSILRWDDVNEIWEPYDGATDGHVLTWDTVNGWQAEASAGGGLADGDKGDITVTSSGAVWTIDNGVVSTAKIADDAVTNDKIRNSAALSVIGRSANSIGGPDDIVCFSDGYVLRQSGTTLGFGEVGTLGIADNAITTAKINNTAVSTAKIADDAVTYAKIQNVVNNNRVLGRVSGANGVIEELTVANLYTLLGITGTATRPAIFTGANTLTTSAQYTWDNTNNRLTIAGTVAGSGPNNAFLNLNSGSLTGTTEFLRASGNITGALYALLSNSNNTSSSSSTILQLLVGGANAGSPMIQMGVSGVVSHAFGVHNADSDKIKFTPNSSSPGGTADHGLILTNDAVPRLGINKDNPKHPGHINGRLMADDLVGKGQVWFVGAISMGPGAGTGASVSSTSGCNNFFQINFNTGTGCVANGNVFTATFPNPWPSSVSYVVFSARSTAASANDISKFYIFSSNATEFVMRANGTLSDSTTYAFSFVAGSYDT